MLNGVRFVKREGAQHPPTSSGELRADYASRFQPNWVCERRFVLN